VCVSVSLCPRDQRSSPCHPTRLLTYETTNPRTSPCIHTHTHPFNGPLSRTTRVSWYQKGKPIWILLKQETVSGSGIRWAIRKSAPRSRQITTPVPQHSIFFTDRMPFLPPNQQRQSTEGILCIQCVLKIARRAEITLLIIKFSSSVN